jgi:hypothetical protein
VVEAIPGTCRRVETGVTGTDTEIGITDRDGSRAPLSRVAA